MPVRTIFTLNSAETFKAQALATFRFQAAHCIPYREYIHLLDIDPAGIQTLEEIPFLPIELFKTHTIYCAPHPPEITFTSSATTGMVPARHPVAFASIYQESFTRGFRHFFGPPEDWVFLALLPSYLERKGSSLVYMTEHLMQASNTPENGFYLYNHKDLYQQLYRLKEAGKKTMLIGVSFALLDFVAAYSGEFPQLHVMETGGMKGRGIDLDRSELHVKLSQRLGTKHIHSEYGMAELLSQAYAKEGALFSTPPWMHIFIRDLDDPFRLLPVGRRGGVNIIDLANYYSCSFIETQDLGLAYTNNRFELLGRIPFSELRGCNMLLE